VYSTCSISPYENDDVVEKTIQKHKHAKLRVIPLIEVFGENFPIGNATALGGWQILPDSDSNWGPIYMCLLERMD
jgi:16S rRNA C967 or C1407 C5-methylase (RsmB/RsmF family)